MDQATQQNAALVEESEAAASGLSVQAQRLVDAVAIFRLSTGAVARGASPAHAPRMPPNGLSAVPGRLASPSTKARTMV
jgi:methyl-accepting chemotaxis protein